MYTYTHLCVNIIYVYIYDYICIFYANMIRPRAVVRVTVFSLVIGGTTASGVVGEADSTQPKRDRYTPGLRC